ERSRLEGHFFPRVVLLEMPAPQPEATAPSLYEPSALGPLVLAIDALLAEPRFEVGVLICPLLALERTPFERLVTRLRALASPAAALAAFHPDAEPDDSSAHRLVPFLRRSPDPTVQVVNLRVLERVREGKERPGTTLLDPAALEAEAELWEQPPPAGPAPRAPAVHGRSADASASASQAPLHRRVAEANLRTVAELGIAELEARLSSIREDRDAAYARVRSLHA
ncbi:MAG: hypothetical protein OEY14_07045, partial [Myxococcales bacterium]|nr:hypothetical protein [Myxococcales bacterium]